MNISKSIIAPGILMLLMVNLSCKKMVEVDLPVDKITKESAYGSVVTAVSTINSVYSDLSRGTIVNPMVCDLGYAADELKPLFSNVNYQNNFADPGSSLFSLWNNFYGQYIYRLNSAIEGVSISAGIPERQKKILIAEAKFTRAFIYFYLVNLYGDVPLILTTDFKVNSNSPRSSSNDVYQQMINDLNDAKADLPNIYLGPDLSNSTIDRVRPTKMAATALLARLYLFHRDWDLAEKEATTLISSSLFSLSDINDVFKKNSSETIWALQPNNLQVNGASNNTAEGYVLKATWFGTTPSNQLTNFLLDSFEPNDKRKIKWVGLLTNSGINYYFANKYQIGGNATQDIQSQEEYSIIFRLSEQYLIRAEARARQNKIIGINSAKEDLDIIRTRAGLSGVSANEPLSMLEAIWHERRVELFTEWGGFRWLDLKRTGTIDEVMEVVTPQKGGQWKSSKALLPIPYYEFNTNPALKGHQNPGYPEIL